MAADKKSAKPKATIEELAAALVTQLATGKVALAKDPRVYELTLPRVIRPHVRFVGLDLATHAGVAFCDIVPGQPVTAATITSGQWYLGCSGDYDSGPLRLVRLRQYLAVLQPDLVMLEDARFGSVLPTKGTQSMTMILSRAVSGAEFLGSLKATVSTWCEEQGVPCHGISSSQLKSFATHRGNASKEDMIAAANAAFGFQLDPATYKQTGVDNIADAAMLCAYAVTLYSEGAVAQPGNTTA
jgi:hypothetical protein